MMKMKTTYSWRAKKYLPPKRKILKKLIEATVAAAGLELDGYGVTVTFVDDCVMARLNWDALQHEGTTDVITFAYLEDGELFPGDTAVELVICADFAWREGAERDDSDFASELTLYMAHGFLHAAGEDDLDPASRKVMRRRESEVMDGLRKQFDFNTVFPGMR
ncbi:MAG: rRNA maturation RNase YbeY [Victivallales bacterium]|nr:rRNA maturation RNase YbeY [Victivallales bacterium]